MRFESPAGLLAIKNERIKVPTNSGANSERIDPVRGTQLARQWNILPLLETRKRGLTAAEISVTTLLLAFGRVVHSRETCLGSACELSAPQGCQSGHGGKTAA